MRHVILIIILFFSTQSTFATNTEATQQFISIADIHFDPFSSCKEKTTCPLIQQLNAAPPEKWAAIFNQTTKSNNQNYYTDTHYLLLKNSLQELKTLNQQLHPQFVLVLGDFLAHHFREKFNTFATDHSNQAYYQFVKKTLQFLAIELQQTFPKTDVYPVIGNNDSYTGNYSIIPRGEFLSQTMRSWAPLIKNASNQQSFYHTFSAMGYYVVTIPNHSNNKIIVLNTVLFSTKVHSKSAKKAAMLQLAWLHQQLLEAKKNNQHILLAMHIPSGIDLFSTVKNNFNITDFWQPFYTAQIEKELTEFSGIVTAVLPGHIHTNIFKLVTLKEFANIPTIFTPSISPLYGNHPGFNVFIYNATTLKIDKVKTYFYPLNADIPTWKIDFSAKSGESFS